MIAVLRGAAAVAVGFAFLADAFATGESFGAGGVVGAAGNASVFVASGGGVAVGVFEALDAEAVGGEAVEGVGGGCAVLVGLAGGGLFCVGLFCDAGGIGQVGGDGGRDPKAE